MFGRIHPSSLGRKSAPGLLGLSQCGLAVLIDMCPSLNRQPFMFSQIGMYTCLGVACPPKCAHSPVHGSKEAKTNCGTPSILV